MVRWVGKIWVELANTREWNQVNMDMVDGKPFDNHAYAGNLEDLFEARRNGFARRKQRLVASIIHVKQIRRVGLGYDECMTLLDWVDIQERQVVIVLPDLVTGDSACNDLTKDAVHIIYVSVRVARP